MIHSAKRPWIVIVGGFLGAGKTTLLLAAAELLRKRGMRPAVILNDQSADLVFNPEGQFSSRFTDRVGFSSHRPGA